MSLASRLVPRKASIITVLALILIAVGCAALATANSFSRHFFVTLTLLSVFFSLPVAISHRGAGRWFFRGFLITGGGYFFFVVLFWTPLQRELFTDDLLFWLYAMLHEKDPLVAERGEFIKGPIFHKDFNNLRIIGHCLWAIALGCAAGWIARRTASPSDSTRATTDN